MIACNDTFLGFFFPQRDELCHAFKALNLFPNLGWYFGLIPSLGLLIPGLNFKLLTVTN